MKKEEIIYIEQLVKVFEKKIPKLKKAHKENKTEEFNTIKKELLKNNEEISEKLK